MRSLVLLAVATTALTACVAVTTSTGGPVSACHNAFTAAAGVDEMADTVSDFYPAVRACSSIEEWSAAFEAHDGAGFTGTAEEVLGNICLGGEVADTPLCKLVQ